MFIFVMEFLEVAGYFPQSLVQNVVLISCLVESVMDGQTNILQGVSPKIK